MILLIKKYLKVSICQLTVNQPNSNLFPNHTFFLKENKFKDVGLHILSINDYNFVLFASLQK